MTLQSMKTQPIMFSFERRIKYNIHLEVNKIKKKI